MTLAVQYVLWITGSKQIIRQCLRNLFRKHPSLNLPLKLLSDVYVANNQQQKNEINAKHWTVHISGSNKVKIIIHHLTLIYSSSWPSPSPQNNLLCTLAVILIIILAGGSSAQSRWCLRTTIWRSRSCQRVNTGLVESCRSRHGAQSLCFTPHASR